MGRLRPAPICIARANLASVGVTTARTAQIDVVARVDTALRVFCSTAATGLTTARTAQIDVVARVDTALRVF